MSETTKQLFGVFPYLRSAGTFSYRRIGFFPNGSPEIPDRFVANVNTLAKMFFLRDNRHIETMTFAAFEAKSDTEHSWFQRILIEFQTIVTFFYTLSDPVRDRSFLTEQHGTLFVLSPNEVLRALLIQENNTVEVGECPYAPADSRGYISGFDGLINGRERLWLAPGSRIYPSVTQLWLNSSQDLARDATERFRGYPCSELFGWEAGRDEHGNLHERILTALQWHNRSCSLDIDENLEIAALAIALETLLDLEQGQQVTERFKEAVTCLCGRINSLDSWLTQFYNCRSSVMHKGRSASRMFNPAWTGKRDSKSPQIHYRSLVSYGRHIFHICLAAILAGTRLANRLGLAKLFVPNHKRLELLCETLSKSTESADEVFRRVGPIIREIDVFRFVPDEGVTRDQLMAASKHLAAKLAAVNGVQQDLAADLTAFASAARADDHYPTLDALRILIEKWDLHYFRDGGDPKYVAGCIFGMTWFVWSAAFYQACRDRGIDVADIEQYRAGTEGDASGQGT